MGEQFFCELTPLGTTPGEVRAQVVDGAAWFTLFWVT